MPSLKVISCHGVGLDKIDLEAARRRGIGVAGTPGVLTDCVADFALGLLIDVARQLCAAQRIIQWIKKNIPQVGVNIMPQYRPEYQAKQYMEIASPVSREEYLQVKEYAETRGLFLL